LSSPWRCGYFQTEVELRSHKEGRTVVKSFRVNEEALGALQDEADRKSVSINTLVNQLLLDYSEFGRFSQGINALRLSKQTFAEILNSVSDEDLVRAGRTAGESAPVAVIASKWGKISVRTVIEFIHDLSAYAKLFEYYEKYENEHWIITLMHELGPKWSTFLSHYIGEALIAAGVQPKTRTSDGTVIFSF
jgi:hypothetical protein